MLLKIILLESVDVRYFLFTVTRSCVLTAINLTLIAPNCLQQVSSTTNAENVPNMFLIADVTSYDSAAKLRQLVSNSWVCLHATVHLTARHWQQRNKKYPAEEAVPIIP
jgi:hypothetical protein